MFNFLCKTVLCKTALVKPKPYPMFNFPCKTVSHRRIQSITTLQKYPPLSISDLNSNLQDYPPLVLHHPFAVSYFIEMFGFSKKSALTISKHINFETSEKPDSIVAFFKNQGFSKTHINTMIKTHPSLLECDADKTLLPTIEFFRSKGVPCSDIVRISVAFPTIFFIDLEDEIIPTFSIISNFLQSDEKTVHVIKRFPRLFLYDVNTYLLPNTSILNDVGVPPSNIVSMFRIQPKILLRSPSELKEIGDTIKNMGFDPTGKPYLTALFVYSSMTKATWDNKVDLFKKLGWSEEEICKAFHLQPICMKSSKHKITAIMSFLVNKMGFTPSAIAKKPGILTSSLEKKIVPRGLFGKDLLSKGYIKNLSLESLFLSPNKVFLNRFVYRYATEDSELLRLYEEKMVLAIEGKY